MQNTHVNINPIATTVVNTIKERLDARLAHFEQDYIPLQATSSTMTHDVMPAVNRLQNFIEDNKQKVLLIIGESGAGKSLFGQRHWQQYCKDWQADKPIPIWLDLALLKETIWAWLNKPPQQRGSMKLLEDWLQGIGLAQKEIAWLQTQPLLLCLDGYDEAGISENLYRANHWEEWPALKVVITCRKQALPQQYREWFYPTVNKLHSPERYQELVLQPISLEQAQAYITERLSGQAELRTRALAYLQHSALQDILRNPLLLQLFITALPELSQQENFIPKIVDIYEKALQGLLQREAQVRGTGNQSLWERYQSLACQCYQAYQLDIEQPLEASSKTLPGFSLPTATTTTTTLFHQTISQVKQDGGVLLTYQGVRNRDKEQHHLYTFFHKSVWEYLVASRLKQEIDYLKQSQVVEAIARADNKITYYLNQRLLQDEPAIVQRIAEWLERDEKLQQALFALIEHSKEYTHITLASANAMTLLCAARVPFSGRNLGGCNVSA